MISRRSILALGALPLLPAPLHAGEPAPEDIYAAFEALLGEPQDRAFFGLPEDRTWRVAKEINAALLGKWNGAGALSTFIGQLSDQTGIVLSMSLLEGAGGEMIYLTPDPVDLMRIDILPRNQVARNAKKTNGVDPGMLARFDDGHLPFVFHMKRGTNFASNVWIAEDEPTEAIEASLVLALVWALGGVTLGQELEGLVDHPAAGAPALTPLGAAVFALMYHPEMKAGLPLAEARMRARRILGLAQ